MGPKEVLLAAFTDELEKIARVPRAVKQYRRALMLRAEKAAGHSTDIHAALGIAKKGKILPGEGDLYGKGTYWNLLGTRTKGGLGTGVYGTYTFSKENRSAIKSLSREGRPTWGVHRTETGTPISRGDTLQISSVPDRYLIGKTRGSKKRPAKRTTQYAVIKAARKRGLHIVEPAASLAVGRQYFTKSRPPMVGKHKKMLIKKTRLHRKAVERAKT